MKPSSTHSIHQESKLPLYYQLYQVLYNKILQGEWQPGHILPSENELVETYGVSRGTVRQALDSLVKEGVIHRRQGRGTFVAHPTIEQGANQMITFGEDMRLRGFEPSSEVLFANLINAPENIAARLNVPFGEELARIERLRFADGEPMTIEESYLVHRLCPGVLRHDYSQNSLRNILQEEYNIYLVRGEQIIRAIQATPELTEQLQLPDEHRAILYIERVSYSQADQAIEFLRLYHRGDRYMLHNELAGWLPKDHHRP